MFSYVREAARLMVAIFALLFGAAAMAGAVGKASEAVANALGQPRNLIAAVYVIALAALFRARSAPSRWTALRRAALLAYAAALVTPMWQSHSPAMGGVGLVAFAIFYLAARYVSGRFLSRLRLEPASNDAPGPRRLVVHVEGNLGAGKSEFCRAVERWASSLGRVELEQLPDALHTAFVADPERFGFALQMVMGDRRATATHRLLHTPQMRHVFVDRGLVGDMAFAVANWALGAIDDEQFAAYRAQYGARPSEMFERAMADGGARPRILYVSTHADECANRVAARGNVDAATEESYLVMVSIAHLLCLLELVCTNSPVRIVVFDGAAKRIKDVRGVKRVLKCLAKPHAAEVPAGAPSAAQNLGVVLERERGDALSDLVEEWLSERAPRMSATRRATGRYELDERSWYQHLARALRERNEAAAKRSK